MAAHSDDVTPIPHQSQLQLEGEMHYQPHCNFNPIFDKFTSVIKASVVLMILQCDNLPTTSFSDNQQKRSEKVCIFYACSFVVSLDRIKYTQATGYIMHLIHCKCRTLAHIFHRGHPEVRCV